MLGERERESLLSFWAQRLGREPTGLKAVHAAVFQARSNTGLGIEERGQDGEHLGKDVMDTRLGVLKEREGS